VARSGSAVLDASVVLRGLAGHQPDAVAWLERIEQDDVEAAWPTLLYAEVANALVYLERAGRIEAAHAQLALEEAMRIPASTTEVALLAEPAWHVARERRLSGYDACYVVLAETLDAPLVTADRALAAATPNAVVI